MGRLAALEGYPPMMRVGLGHDIHRLAPGGPLMLAGVAVPAPFVAMGDSDADVAIHAVIDGVLGAMAWGDIGSWFPRDAVAPGQASGPLLDQVMGRLAAAGGVVQHADVTVLLEAPRLAGHREAMQESLRQHLRCLSVSVKFKTQDGLGSIGRQEAVAAWAAVTVDA